jgi:hypothetical protein
MIIDVKEIKYQTKVQNTHVRLFESLRNNQVQTSDVTPTVFGYVAPNIKIDLWHRPVQNFPSIS